MSTDFVVTGAEAYANVAGLPANVLLYGGPGTLKTTDAVRAFVQGNRCTAFFIPFENGALKPIPARGLPVPDHPREPVTSWAQLYRTMEWLASRRNNYTAVILDGLTELSTKLYREAEETHKSSKNKFTIPVDVRTKLVMLREAIAGLGLHSVFIAHALAPAVQDAIFYPGGFSLSPKSIINDYFGQLHTVLRVDYVGQPGQAPTRVYFTGGADWPQEWAMAQPNDWRYWRTKNREGCGSAIVPADLGAFLRARQPPYQGL